jgi:hypothetical protein
MLLPLPFESRQTATFSMHSITSYFLGPASKQLINCCFGFTYSFLN